MSKTNHHSAAKARTVTKRRSITAFLTALTILCANAVLQPIGFASAITEDLSVTEEIETVTEEMTEPTETGSGEEAETQEAESPMQEFLGESEKGILVTALAAEGVFPADAVMTVTDISYEEALEQAAVTDELAILDAVAVDIMFTNAEGEEIEPDGTVEVRMELPEEAKLEGDRFGLLHLADTGMVETLDEADVSGETARFVTESFSIYVLTSWGEQPINTATHMFNGVELGDNSADNRFVVHVGEPFTVSTDDVNGSAPAMDVTGADLKIVDEASDDHENRCTVTFLPEKTGDCEIRVGDETFYLASKYPINVLTSQGEIDKDRLHEYLKEVHGTDRSDTQMVSDPDGKWVYMKNLDTYHGKYVITEGDTLTVVSYRPADDATLFTCEGDVELDGEQTVEDLPNGLQRVTAVFHVKDVTGDCTAFIQMGSERLVLGIRDAEGEYWSSHADIEIADGGTYTKTSKVIGADGSEVITTTIYDAYVSDVNLCEVYGYDYSTTNTPIQTFVSTDYYRHGVPGEAQYELTSNYIKVDSPYLPEEHGIELPLDNGDRVYVRSDRNVRVSDIDTAKFDIQLLLVPRTEIVTNEKNEVLSETDISDLPDLTFDHVIFDMDHQSVLDAYNKCPLHSGLDFTLKAALNDVIKIEPAALSLEAKKELVNGTVAPESFEFELLDKDKQKIAVVKNDADGRIVFPEQVYLSEGAYCYYIREVVPEKADKILYDTTTYKAVVTVTKDGEGDRLTAAAAYYPDGSETALTDVPTFENKKQYTMPDTGGSGTLPFTFGGIGLMLTAGVLLHKKRHDENA